MCRKVVSVLLSVFLLGGIVFSARGVEITDRPGRISVSNESADWIYRSRQMIENGNITELERTNKYSPPLWSAMGISLAVIVMMVVLERREK